MVVKVDLHVHTTYSGDSTITLSQLATRLKQLSLDAVAITDHNTSAAVAKAMRMADSLGAIIIPGIEVSTPQGDLIVLGFDNDLPLRGNAEELVEEARGKGYVAIAPHPYDERRNSLMDYCMVLRDKLSALEVLNARSDRSANQKASQAAKLIGKMGTAGSDAHEISEVGCVYNEVLAERDLSDILEAFKRGAKVVIRRLDVHGPVF